MSNKLVEPLKFYSGWPVLINYSSHHAENILAFDSIPKKLFTCLIKINTPLIFLFTRSRAYSN